eukprot:jgi/Botrbrau1/13552/Bobra.4_2s0010.1
MKYTNFPGDLGDSRDRGNPGVAAMPLQRSETRYCGSMMMSSSSFNMDSITMLPSCGEWMYPDGSSYIGTYSIEVSPASDSSLHANSHSPFGRGECTRRDTVLGEYKLVGGDIYLGEIKKGQCHGWGEYKWKDGNRYVGQFLYDRFHGYGEFTGDPVPLLHLDPNFGAKQISMIWRNYKGGWHKNRFHGSGTVTSVDGKTSQGDFDKGKIICLSDLQYDV